jgi:hypothetical protein
MDGLASSWMMESREVGEAGEGRGSVDGGGRKERDATTLTQGSPAAPS